jgi:hypothetical protein
LKLRAISEPGSWILVKNKWYALSSGYSSRSFLHLPDKHVSLFITLGAVLSIPTLIAAMHHFHFPARREGPHDDFSGPFQVQSLQVPNSEELAAPDDAADDETCTARVELPLRYGVRERERDGVGKFCKIVR